MGPDDDAHHCRQEAQDDEGHGLGGTVGEGEVTPCRRPSLPNPALALMASESRAPKALGSKGLPRPSTTSKYPMATPTKVRMPPARMVQNHRGLPGLLGAATLRHSNGAGSPNAPEVMARWSPELQRPVADVPAPDASWGRGLARRLLQARTDANIVAGLA
jgi:hypothetical protein